MSIVNESDNGAFSFQSAEDKNETNNSITRVDLLAALVKWIAPTISSDEVIKFVVWYFFGNFEKGTECQIAIKQGLEPFLPIVNKSIGNLTFSDEIGKMILNLCISYMRNYKSAMNYDKKYDNILVSTLCKWGARNITNDCEGNSPLRLAMEKRRMDLVQTLVRFGYTESSNSLGQNILHTLVNEYSNHKTNRKSSIKIIRYLIRRRADFNEPDKDGVTPVHLAAKSMNIKLLKMFVKHGADLHSRTNTGDNLLILVCHNLVKQTNKSKALQLINWLLHQGFDANSRNKNNFTPLHYASQSRHLAVVKTLVEAGADLHAVARDGTTCLHSAAMSDSFEIMQYLIDCGVTSNAPEKMYKLTLMHMAAFSYDEKSFKWLAKNGFDLNDNGYGYTPLHLASMTGNAKVIKKLIKHGADVHIQGKTYHHTALHFASMGGQFANIQKIHSAEWNVDTNEDNLSLDGSFFPRLRLQRASEADYESTIDVLLKSGANVNAKSSCNCTPLHYAMRQPNDNLIEVLICSGAHVDVQNNEYFTPLHYSSSRIDDRGIKYLLTFGANINDIEHPSREIHEELRKCCCFVRHFVVKYLSKLKAARLPISNVFGRYFDQFDFESLSIRYTEELKKLKEQMIAPNVSLYDLLHMNFKRRVQFVDRLPVDLKREFHFYFVLIKSKCNEAINRNGLMEPAKIAFGTLTGIQWPDLCVEHILTFLNNSTLRVLIDT